MLNSITDPLKYLSEDTVMAYRNPLSGQWPNFFTDNDLSALVNVWEQKHFVLEMEGKCFLQNYEAVEGGRGDDDFEVEEVTIH